MRTFYYFILILLIISIPRQKLKGHSREDRVRGQLIVSDSKGERWSRNIGGYGYVGLSEAESYSSFNFECETEDINRYLECSSGLLNPWSTDRRYIINLAKSVSSPILLQRLREKMAEKFILEYAALTKAKNRTHNALGPLPQCLQEGSKRKKNEKKAGSYATTDDTRNNLTSLYKSLPGGITEEEEFKSLSPEARRTRNKFNSILNSYSSGNLLRSVLLHDQLIEQHKHHCKGTTKFNLNVYTDLTNQINRIRESYPLLYEENNDLPYEVNTTTARRHGKDKPTRKRRRFCDYKENPKTKKMKNSIYDLLGSSYDLPGVKPQKDGRKKGKQRYEAHTNITNVGGNVYKDFEADVSKKIKAAFDANEKKSQGLKLSKKEKRLAKAFSNLNKSITNIQLNYKKLLSKRMKGICKLKLNEVVKKFPNVVRQAMADFGPENKGLMKAVLCSTNLRKKITPKAQCAGVYKTTTEDTNDTIVKRYSTSWPYGSYHGYQIKRSKSNPDAPPVVKMNVNFPTTITPESKAKRFIEQYKKNVEDYYNCSSGITPPHHFGPVTTGCFNVEKSQCTNDMQETFPKMPCPQIKGMEKIKFEFSFNPVFPCKEGQTSDKNNCYNKMSDVKWPKFNLHNCYNPDIDSKEKVTDCDEVKKHSRKTFTKYYQQIRKTGRGPVNPDAVEFDDYLDNINSPFAKGTDIMKNKCSKKDQNINASTDHCDELLAKVDIKGKNFNCKSNCIKAVQLCRFPKYECLSDQMIERLVTGQYDDKTGTWDNPEKPAGHPIYNRANSNNLSTTVTLGTFIHEVGHKLNLKDEYKDPTKPFAPQGEHDSLMNHSDQESKFYPRHLKKILEPENCSQTIRARRGR